MWHSWAVLVVAVTYPVHAESLALIATLGHWANVSVFPLPHQFVGRADIADHTTASKSFRLMSIACAVNLKNPPQNGGCSFITVHYTQPKTICQSFRPSQGP